MHMTMDAVTPAQSLVRLSGVLPAMYRLSEASTRL